MPGRPVTYRLGVDIGGTFTDVALLGSDGSVGTTKVLSTPDDYARAVVAGAVSLLEQRDVRPADVTAVVHASTVASNTILEGRGARTALVTTRGFRDVLEMRRLRIPVLYDVQYERPEPLVPRRRRFEVVERLGPRGEVKVPLDEASVAALVPRLQHARVEALAVCLLHSYANDAHERRVAEILRAALGDDVFVTCSFEILPEIREYERTSTTVVNAYVGPAVAGYLERLERSLAAVGLVAPLELMQSSGGTLRPADARRRPAHLVESGPAAGVIACGHLARATGRRNVVSFDMGGTTAKAALLEDGEPVRTSEYEVGAGINLSSRLVKGGGHAIRLPFVDVSEIGAGGGSIVSVDRHGAVQVGPRSAGAAPGPVCYGAGGTEPTLTDALLALGYLNDASLVGGAVSLDGERARVVLRERVAAPLGVSLEAAAHGVLRLAVATMTRAVKAVTTYRGRDPRDFTLCAFGGNGPLTAVEIARALGIRHVLVPPSPGVFSALGLLFSDTEHELVRTVMLPGSDLSGEALDGAFADLEARARSAVAKDASDVEVSIGRVAELRYAGQAYELAVALPPGPVDVAHVVQGFVDEHVATYGHGSADDPVELVAVRVVARIVRAEARRLDHRSVLGDARRRETVRRACFGDDGWIETPVCDRAALRAGPRRGPLLVDEVDSTTVVPPGCEARLDEHANIEVEVDEPPR